METTTILTKTTATGKIATVELSPNGILSATLDGQPIGEGLRICVSFEMNGKSIVGAVGKLALTRTERTTVENALEQRQAAQRKPLSPARIERNRIHRMFDRAESKRDWPGEYFPAINDAKAALEAWAAKYAEEAKAEADDNAAGIAERKARRDKDFANSFIGRGLD